MKEEIKEQQNAATPQVENKNETCCCGENNNHGACKHHHHHEKHHEQHEKVQQDSKALEAANTKIAELTAKNSDLRLQASQAAQNSYLINALNPTPIPAYTVANPYSGYHNCGCNTL